MLVGRRGFLLRSEWPLRLAGCASANASSAYQSYLPQVDLLGTGLLSNFLRRSGVSEQRNDPIRGRRRAAILTKSPNKWEMGFQPTQNGSVHASRGRNRSPITSMQSSFTGVCFRFRPVTGKRSNQLAVASSLPASWLGRLGAADADSILDHFVVRYLVGQQGIRLL